MSAALEDRSAVLRDRIDEQEAELRLAVRELKQATRQTFDLGHQLASHPAAWLAGAFAVGLWIGGRRR